MTRWRRLSPAGLGAVTLLELVGELGALQLTTRGGVRLAPPAAGAVRHAILRDGARVLDEVLLVGTERGAELHLHGGEAVFQQVTTLLARHGYAPDDGRPATETVHSLRHARALLSSRRGPLSDLLERLARPADAEPNPGDVARRLDRALSLTGFAERLARPAVVRITGRPNVGKSTLFNRWVGSERALVSPHAGTTRDTVGATVMLRGVPIRLEDTAGGEPAAVEDAGADLRVHLVDPARPLDAHLEPGAGQVLVVLGRADERPANSAELAVSGRTGAGCRVLLELVAERLGLSGNASDDVWAPLLAGQVQALAAARQSLDGPA